MATNTNPIKYSDLVKPDGSITELIKQLDELSDAYASALRGIKAEAIQLSASLQKVSGATEEGRAATRKAAAEADRLAKVHADLAFAESENAKKLAELKQASKEQNDINKLLVKINQSAEGSYNRLSAQYSLNKIYLNNMSKAERESTKEGQELERQTREIYEEMKRLQEATGKHQLNVGNYREASEAVEAYGDKLKETLGLNTRFGDSLLAMGRGGAAAKGMLKAVGDGALALGRTLLTLLANPVFLAMAGIAAAGAAFKWWFDYNSGLVEATRLTSQFTGKSGEDLKRYRNQAQAVADTFGADFKDTLTAANAVAKQFGVSADEALAAVRDGFVAGGDANGEFLDTLKEYPAYFQQAGLSAREFVAVVAQAGKSVVFSDKAVDSIKEADLRLREMTPATASALEGIGMSAEAVKKGITDGSQTTFQVIRQVSERLSELPANASEVGTAVADIFGGPGEDAGLQYLTTLKDIETNLDKVKEQSGELGRLQEANLRSQANLKDAVSNFADATGGVFENLSTKLKTGWNNFAAWVVDGLAWLVNDIAIGVKKTVLAVKNGGDMVKNTLVLLRDLAVTTGKVVSAALRFDFDGVRASLDEYGDALSDFRDRQVKDMRENWEETFGEAPAMPQVPAPQSGAPKEAGKSNTPTASPADREAKERRAKEVGEREKRAEAERKAEEDAYKQRLDAARKREDAELEMETDEWAKRRAATQRRYAREIEDLRHRLDTEAGMQAETRRDIEATIAALMARQSREMVELERERQEQQAEAYRRGLEARLQAAAKGSEQERQIRALILDAEERQELEADNARPEGQRQGSDAIKGKYARKRGELADEGLAAELAAFDQRQALAQAEFDLLRNSEERKTRFRLQAEKERLQKVLELNERANAKMSEAEVAAMQARIKGIDQEMAGSARKERSQDIYGMLGLNLDDEQKSAINTAMDTAKQALNDFMQARVDAADKAVEAAAKETEAAQDALDKEKEARANGYASNVAQAQKELELKKKTEAQAVKDRQKAMRQQQAVQTIQQIGDLVTATAMIWSQLGFPAAIPAMAVMWASFAASKIKAAQLAKSAGAESYGQGTVELLGGGSHQSGRDVDLGTRPDGTRRRAEGGEFFAVINKRASRKYRRVIPDLIRSLNNDTYAARYADAFAAPPGITVADARDGWRIDGIARDVEEIRRQNARRTHVDASGRTVTTYKNTTRITRK